MQKSEAKPPRARYVRGTSQVHGRYM
jgi:hypothetical protein